MLEIIGDNREIKTGVGLTLRGRSWRLKVSKLNIKFNKKGIC